MESRSKTPFASGWLPRLWWSPLRQRMFLIPRAEAPRTSDCKAMRFRSLVTICSTGSSPSPFKITHEARLERRTTPVWLSVTLTLSTYVLRRRPLFRITSGSAPFGGPHSAVTAKWPMVSTFLSLLSVITLSDPPSRFSWAPSPAFSPNWRADIPRPSIRSGPSPQGA